MAIRHHLAQNHVAIQQRSVHRHRVRPTPKFVIKTGSPRRGLTPEFAIKRLRIPQSESSRAAAQTAAHIDVVTLTDDDALDVVRSAGGGLSRLDMSSLFRILRRGELLTILGRRVGYSIDVPSAQIYRRLNALFMQLPLDTAYDEFVAALRERDLRSRQAARDAQLPASLSAAASGLSLTPPGWRRLAAQLGCPAHEFRTRGTQGNGHGSIRSFNSSSIR